MPERGRLGWSQQPVIEEFRANGGKVGGYYADCDLLLLTTTGVRSGRRHVAPLSYLADGERYVVAAAGGGTGDHPDWYYNLLANPRVIIEIGTVTFDATAAVVPDDERDDLYDQVAARYPQLLDYQASTTHQIPLVALIHSRGNGRN